VSPRLPLSGVRVVEFAHMILGPACGLVLADLGAEVIKVEPLEGDSTRRLTGSGAGYWSTYNRNKKSVAVDLKAPEGLAFAHQLIASADILVENFRPGAMERMGLGYEAVSRLNGRIVYCSLKGFLPGPHERRPALDEVVQMMSGLSYMTGPEGRPLRAGASVNDVMAGVFGAVGILAALRERETTGRGQLVRSGLFENSVFLVAQHMMQYRVTGRPAVPMPDRVPAWAVYDSFGTAGGEQVFVGVVSDSQWQPFCAAFGLAGLAADPELATNNQRVARRERFIPQLRALFETLTREELMARCERAGVPFAPLVRPQDLFDDPHLNESGFTEVTLPGAGRSKVPKLPLEMDGRRFGARLDLPELGGDAAALLAEMGHGPAGIEDLRARGIIGGGR